MGIDLDIIVTDISSSPGTHETVTADLLDNLGSFTIPRPNLEIIGLDSQCFPSNPMSRPNGKRRGFKLSKSPLDSFNTS
jgi:hypothetical protein